MNKSVDMIYFWDAVYDALRRVTDSHWDEAYIVTEFFISEIKLGSPRIKSSLAQWMSLPNATVVRPETLTLAKQVGTNETVELVEQALNAGKA